MAIDTPPGERFERWGRDTTTAESEQEQRLTDRDSFVASFPPIPASVRAARSFVANLVPEGFRDYAVLLVSELATNAVLYAGTSPFEVRVQLTPTRRIEIRDTSFVAPTMSDPSVNEPHGRGLRLVDTLASAWGVNPDENGKIVWFEF